MPTSRAQVLRPQAKLDKRAEWLVEHLTGWAGRSLFLDFSTPASALAPQVLEVVSAKMAAAGIQPVLVVSPKLAITSPYRTRTCSPLTEDLRSALEQIESVLGDLQQRAVADDQPA